MLFQVADGIVVNHDHITRIIKYSDTSTLIYFTDGSNVTVPKSYKLVCDKFNRVQSIRDYPE